MFGLGLWAAAFSSAISVALGNALTWQSLLAQPPKQNSASQGTGSETEPRSSISNTGSEGGGSGDGGWAQTNEGETVINPLSGAISTPVAKDTEGAAKRAEPTGRDTGFNGGSNGTNGSNGAPSAAKPAATEGPWAETSWQFRGMIVLVVGFAFIIGASGANTIIVVFTAQVRGRFRKI